MLQPPEISLLMHMPSEGVADHREQFIPTRQAEVLREKGLAVGSFVDGYSLTEKGVALRKAIFAIVKDV